MRGHLLSGVQVADVCEHGPLEADCSLTNKQNVRIEANAGYAVERIPSAGKIT
jgi:hypothetical protein